MRGRFPTFALVRLKSDVPREPEPWPSPGQRLVIIANLTEDFPNEPGLYLCEWDIAGTKPQNRFLEDQLEPWPG